MSKTLKPDAVIQSRPWTFRPYNNSKALKKSKSSCSQITFEISSIKNLLTRNVSQIILYYHVTKLFLSCLHYFIKCIRFQNMFWRNISCFRFWWKIYTKRCTNNNVIPRVKRLSSPALCAWSISGHDLEMEECRIRKNIELKIWR